MKRTTCPWLSLFLVAACGNDAGTTPAGGTGTPGTPSGDMGHGAAQSLGSLTIGAHTFEVVQEGAVTTGQEAFFDLVFAAGKPLPAAARAWIGIDTAVGSMKARLGKEGEHTLHGHVDVPKVLPPGSKLWVEIEDGGKTAQTSVAWK